MLIYLASIPACPPESERDHAPRPRLCKPTLPSPTTAGPHENKPRQSKQLVHATNASVVLNSAIASAATPANPAAAVHTSCAPLSSAAAPTHHHRAQTPQGRTKTSRGRANSSCTRQMPRSCLIRQLPALPHRRIWWHQNPTLLARYCLKCGATRQALALVFCKANCTPPVRQVVETARWFPSVRGNTHPRMHSSRGANRRRAECQSCAKTMPTRPQAVPDMAWECGSVKSEQRLRT